MNLLFVCSIEYQILNAVNIKLNMHPNDYADIIVETTGSKQGRFVEELKKSGLFGKVLCKKEPSLGIHDYIRYLRDNKEYPYTEFGAAVLSDIHNLKINMQRILKDESVVLKDLIDDFDLLDYKKYDIIFAQGNNKVVNNLYHLIKRNTNCKMAILDEGVGSCYIDNLGGKNTKVDMAYLYAPDICSYYDSSDIVFKKIPAIRSNDTLLISILNNIFDYVPQQYQLNSRIIMFDQGCQKMPNYLKNIKGIKRIFLKNTYNKHLTEGIMYENQIKIFKLIAEKYKSLFPIIKMHPRPAHGIQEEYENANIEVMKVTRVPWEIICSNENVSNSIMITICSTAAYLMQFVVENMKKNDIILLYKIVNLTVPKECEEFFNKYQAKYSDKVFVPKNEKELVYILDKLNKRKENNDV